ncbi:MAG TPA: pitrilysin family protein [Bryobacteraceae bacterium]|nr:pitrilysin family protein [Bryobacteraceae bacterium]
MLKRSILTVAMAALALGAQTVDRTKPPQTGPIPSYKLPSVYETKLPNGLGVLLVEDTRFPLVTARLAFLAGSKYDPKDLPGLSEAVAAVMTEGTKTRSARQISEETDAIGGSLAAGAGADSLTVSGGALSEHFTKLLVLMADVTRNAAFPEDEVNLHKQDRVQNLMQQRSEPGFLAEEKMAEVLYGSSPYAHIAPTEASIGKLDPKVLANFRDTYLVPNNATLVVIGKLPARAEVMKAITEQFGSWQQKALPPVPKMDTPAPKRQIVLVDRPGSVQADIHVGKLAPARTTPEFFPLMVGNTILGGGANSRMFKNIREKEGFAYDAHSEYDTHRDTGDFEAVTQVRNDVIEPALKAVLAELDHMSGAPVAADELTGIKGYLAGMYLLRLETQDGLANQLSTMKVLGLPNDYLETYTTRMRSVEPDQVLAAAKKYMAPGDASIVVVGDASKITDILKKFGDVTVAKSN